MENKIDVVRSLLNTLGYTQESVKAGIDALDGRKTSPVYDEEILTAQQLCARLQISMTSLWRMQPPFLRVGGRKRYSWVEVKNFLANSSAKQHGQKGATK